MSTNDHPTSSTVHTWFTTPTTKLYILWWNYAVQNNCAVASSVSPFGQFVLCSPSVNVTRTSGSDFDFFVDCEGQGYVFYSANFSIGVELSTPDFYYSAGGGLIR